MNVVKRSDIPELNSESSKVFRDFLFRGLRGLFEEGKGRYAFGIAARYIGNDQDLCFDLQDIHDCLAPSEQMAFQQGVLDALADTVHLAPSVVFPIATNLIKLAGQIRATGIVDILPPLMRLLRNMISARSFVGLVEMAYTSVVAVASPSPRTKTCILELNQIASPEPILAYPALLALASSDATHIAENLELLWPQLNKLLGWTAADMKDAPQTEERLLSLREDLILEVLARVGPWNMARTLSPEGRMAALGDDKLLHWMDEVDWWYATINSHSTRMHAVVDALASTDLSPSDTMHTLQANFRVSDNDNYLRVDAITRMATEKFI